MPAGIYNLTIEQGATFILPVTWKDANDNPINLTGYTARMQVRQYKDSTAALVTATTENNGIVLGGALGTITITITATATAALPAIIGFYDLELVSGAGTVSRLLQGTATISAEVTK
jgi:hypothetical protein